MINPWLCNNPLYPPGTETCDAESRMHKIRESSDLAWLRQTIAWRGSQKTVRLAAERRLRVLSKQRTR